MSGPSCSTSKRRRPIIPFGKYPARLHLTGRIPSSNYPWAKMRSPNWTQHLPSEEVPLAGALGPAGYVTAAVGKWPLARSPSCRKTRGSTSTSPAITVARPGAISGPMATATRPGRRVVTAGRCPTCLPAASPASIGRVTTATWCCGPVLELAFDHPEALQITSVRINGKNLNCERSSKIHTTNKPIL